LDILVLNIIRFGWVRLYPAEFAQRLDKTGTGLDTDRRAAAVMKKKRPRLQPSEIAPPLLAAGFFLAACLASFLPAGWLADRIWKGYYTVSFSGSARLGELLQELQRQPGVPAVVSRYTARVSVNTFSGYEQIPLHRLADRLDPADPRLDPYLRSAGNYFSQPASGGSSELAYVRTERGPLFLALRLARLLSGAAVRFRVLELDPLSSLLRAAFAAAAGWLLIRRMPRSSPRLLLALGLLPWLLRAGAGEARDLFAFFFLYPLWLRASILAMNRPAAAERGRRRPARRRRAGLGLQWARFGHQAVLAGAAAAVMVLVAPGFRHLTGSALAAAADLFLLALFPLAAALRNKPEGHRPFRAVPILSSGAPRLLSGSRPARTYWHYTPAAWALPMLLAALPLASVPVLWLAKYLRGQEAPSLQAGGSGSAAFSWAALSRLPLTSDSDGLPHLADFVAHRAFQESLGFNRPYSLPHPDERLYLSTYLPAGGGNGILQSSRVVKRFSDSWLRMALASAPPGSLQRLLLDQGRAGQVRRLRETQLFASSRPLARGAAATLFLLVLLLLEEIGLTGRGSSGRKSSAL
jgi:hypothetical protein